MHGLEHWTHFYTDYGVDIQKQFFAHFLKGEKNGWDKRPKVQLQVRHLARSLSSASKTSGRSRAPSGPSFICSRPGTCWPPKPPKQSAKLEFEAMGDGLTFISAPLAQETEITGPLAAKLFVSSSTTDADMFLVFKVYTPDLREVRFLGAIDPHTPVAQGWLRASHRKLDPEVDQALPALSHAR